MGFDILLTTLVPALVPAVVDAFRGVFTWITGGEGAKPANFDELLKLKQLEIEKLKVLAAIDQGVGSPSQWVVNLRMSSRYLAVAAILLVWASLAMLDALDVSIGNATWMMVNDLAQMASFFLFGDRMYANIKGKNNGTKL